MSNDRQAPEDLTQLQSNGFNVTSLTSVPLRRSEVFEVQPEDLSHPVRHQALKARLEALNMRHGLPKYRG